MGEKLSNLIRKRRNRSSTSSGYETSPLHETKNSEISQKQQTRTQTATTKQTAKSWRPSAKSNILENNWTPSSRDWVSLIHLKVPSENKKKITSLIESERKLTDQINGITSKNLYLYEEVLRNFMERDLGYRNARNVEITVNLGVPFQYLKVMFS